MAISLTKGTPVSLTKAAEQANVPNASAVSDYTVGLGWDPASTGQEVDLDAFAIVLDSAGQAVGDKEFVFFNNLTNPNSSVVHTGDNLTGEGDDDDERIQLKLGSLPNGGASVVIGVNSFKGQDLSSVANAFARVFTTDGETEVARYDLTTNSGHTGVMLAKLVKSGEGWTVEALGDHFEDFAAQVRGYGVNV